MWEIFDQEVSDLSQDYVEANFKKYFIPFPNRYWEDIGDVVVFHKCVEKEEISLAIGYFSDGKLAVSIEGYNRNATPKSWSFCADPDKLVSGEIFYTKNDIFFPKMSVVSAETAFEVLKEFVSSPFDLPKSVLWTKGENITWPEKL